MEVGIERLIPPVATEERYGVTAREATTAPKSKYGRELLGQTRVSETWGN